MCFLSQVRSSLNRANERQANKSSFRTTPRETVVLFFPENDKIIDASAELPGMVLFFCADKCGCAKHNDDTGQHGVAK